MVSERYLKKKLKKENSDVKLRKKKKMHSQVLQRKTEEAAMATKRLKELLEARKSSPREHSGVVNNSTLQMILIVNGTMSLCN